jgi:hypothetical protein
MYNKRKPKIRETHVRAFAIIFSVAVILGIAFGTGIVHIDHTAGQFGISAGADTHYCSLEVPAGWSCETAN